MTPWEGLTPRTPPSWLTRRGSSTPTVAAVATAAPTPRLGDRIRPSCRSTASRRCRSGAGRGHEPHPLVNQGHVPRGRAIAPRRPGASAGRTANSSGTSATWAWGVAAPHPRAGAAGSPHRRRPRPGRSRGPRPRASTHGSRCARTTGKVQRQARWPGDLVLKPAPGPYLELFARQPRLGWDHWGTATRGGCMTAPDWDFSAAVRRLLQDDGRHPAPTGATNAASSDASTTTGSATAGPPPPPPRTRHRHHRTAAPGPRRPARRIGQGSVTDDPSPVKGPRRLAVHCRMQRRRHRRLLRPSP